MLTKECVLGKKCFLSFLVQEKNVVFPLWSSCASVRMGFVFLPEKISVKTAYLCLRTTKAHTHIVVSVYCYSQRLQFPWH